MDRILEDIKSYARNFNVPIMQDPGMDFLTNYIKEHDVKRILEIGSAIGYSAIRMALVRDDIKVTTIERDITRYNEAVKNINNCNLSDRIEIILGDALDTSINGSYDLIFIDAAKAQYIKFFLKYQNNLDINGSIISDNLNFHGLTDANMTTLSRNVRGLVRKINNYKEFLIENKEFKTEFYDIGDGIGVSTRYN